MAKFIIDAGHSYSTQGKRTPDGMREYEFNSVVAKYVRDGLLDYENVSVKFTHSDTRDVPLSERADIANSWNADAFISIHANAFGSGWNSAHGIETYVYDFKYNEAEALAKKVQSQLVKQTGLSNRGVKEANFAVLRESNMPAILCECGFMTNKKEAALLKSDAYRKKCAKAIVAGIADQYNLKPKNQPKTSTERINIITGSYVVGSDGLADLERFLKSRGWNYRKEKATEPWD